MERNVCLVIRKINFFFKAISVLEMEQDKEMKRGWHHPQQTLLSADYIPGTRSAKRNKITGYL